MIKKGDKVTIDYTGKLSDGTVFDTSKQEGREPLKFEVGSGQVIPGFDDAVSGMKKGEKKDVVIEPKKAYGERNEQLKKAMPKSQIPNSENIKKGMTLAVQTPQGQVPVNVADVTDESVVLDLNHPLAGKELHFHIEVVDVSS